MIEDVESAAAALYGGPIESFVAERDAMAKALRADGHREVATAVKALRKPTVVADALNKALRADPDVVDALIDAAAALRRAQEAMLAGERGDFADRRADYRAAVETVVDLADGHDDPVRTAVEAAAIGGLEDELRAAAFAVPPQPSGGFGPFELGVVEPASGTRTARKAGSKKGPADKGAAKRPGAKKTGAKKTGAKGTAKGGSKKGAASADVEDELERKRAERAARRAAEEAVAGAAVKLQEAEQALDAADELVGVLDATATDLEAQMAALETRLAETRAAREDAVAVRLRAEAEVDTAGDRAAEAKQALDQLGRPRGTRRR